MHTDQLGDIVNHYNNRYHSKIKVKAVDLKWNTHFDSSKEINNQDLQFKISEFAIISKYKKIFVKGYTRNWS